MIVVAAFFSACSNPVGSSSSDVSDLLSQTDESSSDKDDSNTGEDIEANEDGSYNITFYGNDSTASGSMTTLTYLPGVELTLPGNTFSSPTYSFDRWNTQADGSGSDYADKASFTMPSEHIDLYAVWPGMHTVYSSSDERPYGIVMHPDGNLYFIDSYSEQVKKCTLQGVVSLVAGKSGGDSLFSDGTGTSASFYQLTGIAVDTNGDLLLTDHDYLRRCTTSGIVTTIADSSSLISVLGLDVDENGNIYLAGDGGCNIREVDTEGNVSVFAGYPDSSNVQYGMDDGVGTAATFYNPKDVAFDSHGNLYVADGMNYSVRKIAPDATVSTFAGTGSQGDADGSGSDEGFNSIRSLCVDKNDNVYVLGQYKIYKIDSSGCMTSITYGASGDFVDGPLPTAKFNIGYGITSDTAGNLYFGDYSNKAIRKVVF